MYPMRSYKWPYLKVVVGGHLPVGCWHYQLTRGSAGTDARKTLTLELMAFSLHAHSSSSLRRLRPAVPPIAMFRALVETVAVIRSAGTRTSGSNMEARRIVSGQIAEIVNEHFLNPRGKGIDTNLANVDSNIVIVIVC